MPIQYPIILPPQGVRSITLRPKNSVMVSTSPFTGQQKVQANQGQWWEADVDFAAMKQSGYADDMAAALTSLRGQFGTFLLGDSSRKTPRGSASQIATGAFVWGGGQTGHELITRGWSASTSQVMRAGDYIQIGGQNLLKRSEEFNHGDWGKSNVSVSLNSALAPDGTMNADVLNAGSGDCYIGQFAPTQIGLEHTFSIWLKSGSGTVNTEIAIADSSFGSNGVSITTSWQRFSVTKKCQAASCGFFIGRGQDIPDGAVIHAWGAQANLGLVPDQYIATNDAPVSTTRRLHKLLVDAYSDVDGQSTLTIWPRLRSSPQAYDKVKTSNCVGTFRLASNDQGWSVDPAKIYSAGISAVEDLTP